MMQTTLGQLMVNNALPAKFRDYKRMLTKDAADDVLAQIAKDDPESYKDISFKLMSLGREAAFTEGTTLRLSDLKMPIDRNKLLATLAVQERKIHNDRTMTPAEKDVALEGLYGDTQKLITTATYDATLAANNPFALQVKSKARGNKAQLTALLSTPSVYQDANDKTIPVFIKRSYAEGLDPAEFWAAMYGARKSVISSKFATRDAGALGKQFGVAVARIVITGDDCETPYGIPVKTDDNDNLGAVMAKAAGGFPVGTVINKEVMAHLKHKNVDEVMLRSPMTCGFADGVCKQCAGQREDGKFPEIGHHLGLNATSALAERIAQGSLNVKHCLTCCTIILCADWSSKRIDALKPGDMIMGSDLHGNMRPVRIVNVFDNGPRDCWRTEFIQNGAHLRTATRVTLESTLDHKLLATRFVVGQKDEELNGQLREIQVGQKSRQFYAMRPAAFDDTGLVSEPWALLCGLLLGDGCYTEAVNGVHLSTADDLLKQELEPYLTSNNLKLTKLAGQKYYHRVSIVDDPIAARRSDGTFETGSRNPAQCFLEKYGMDGKYAQDKVIPDAVHGWDNASVAQLIAGLIITDGSIYPSDGNGKPGIAFVSTSKKMVEQLRYLLGMRFGIWASELTCVQRAGERNGWNFNFDQWQITITSYPQVQRFVDCIPMLGAKRVYLKQLLTDCNVQERFNFCGLKRISQSFIGIRPTMDIEVDHPDHLFVLANGLIVSNSGGQSGSYAGFSVIDQLAKIPKTFPNKATVAELDGTVEEVTPAPQGGYNILIGDKEHYVGPELPLVVKRGDVVEAGDQLSQGIVNPADAVHYKGIGEGRRYFADRMTQAFKESSYDANRRNVEVLARALIDHVSVDDPDGLGDSLPGDVVSYNAMAYAYKPRADAKMLLPKQAIGQYLEQPAMHYSIGTRITNKMAATMAKHGVDSVMSHTKVPGFTPHMISVVKVPGYDDDWMARLGSTYLESRLLEDVHRGASSKMHSLHPIPSLARGVEFGKQEDEEFTY